MKTNSINYAIERVIDRKYRLLQTNTKLKMCTLTVQAHQGVHLYTALCIVFVRTKSVDPVVPVTELDTASVDMGRYHSCIWV